MIAFFKRLFGKYSDITLKKKATADGNGSFVFDDVTPGAYQILVKTDGTHEYFGHVTVLK